MKIAIAFVLAALLLNAPSAFASEMTDADYRYLQTHRGVHRDGSIVQTMTADDRSHLHALINDPDYGDRPQTVENQVGDYLFLVETCANCPLSDPRPCPNAPKSGDPSGKQVADRACLPCHLVGTVVAPSFFKLAKQGGWSAARLDAALRGGHHMSPITLSMQELNELSNYIASLAD